MAGNKYLDSVGLQSVLEKISAKFGDTDDVVRKLLGATWQVEGADIEIEIMDSESTGDLLTDIVNKLHLKAANWGDVFEGLFNEYPFLKRPTTGMDPHIKAIIPKGTTIRATSSNDCVYFRVDDDAYIYDTFDIIPRNNLTTCDPDVKLVPAGLNRPLSDELIESLVADTRYPDVDTFKAQKDLIDTVAKIVGLQNLYTLTSCQLQAQFNDLIDNIKQLTSNEVNIIWNAY